MKMLTDGYLTNMGAVCTELPYFYFLSTRWVISPAQDVVRKIHSIPILQECWFPELKIRLEKDSKEKKKKLVPILPEMTNLFCVRNLAVM